MILIIGVPGCAGRRVFFRPDERRAGVGSRAALRARAERGGGERR